MKWTLFAASAALAAALWLPGEAAQPAGRTGTDDAITFEQYRDWRLNFIERRRSELAIELARADLPAERKARLEQVKSYYDWYAGLPAADRDRRFRERFDRIDADHDGQIDHGERAAWREQQRAFYHRGDAARQQRAATAAPAQ